MSTVDGSAAKARCLLLQFESGSMYLALRVMHTVFQLVAFCRPATEQSVAQYCMNARRSPGSLLYTYRAQLAVATGITQGCGAHVEV